MSNEAYSMPPLTIKQINFLRSVLSCEVADRVREIQKMRDPNDPDRFANIRNDAEEARQIAVELLGMLPPNDSEMLEIPLFLRRNRVK